MVCYMTRDMNQLKVFIFAVTPVVFGRNMMNFQSFLKVRNASLTYRTNVILLLSKFLLGFCYFSAQYLLPFLAASVFCSRWWLVLLRV